MPYKGEFRQNIEPDSSVIHRVLGFAEQNNQDCFTQKQPRVISNENLKNEKKQLFWFKK